MRYDQANTYLASHHVIICPVITSDHPAIIFSPVVHSTVHSYALVLKQFFSVFLLFIFPGSTKKHSSYGWHYWPHDNERAPCGLVGIINLGATCYMASCIQQLFMMPEAKTSILNAKVFEDKFPTLIHSLSLFPSLPPSFSLYSFPLHFSLSFH